MGLEAIFAYIAEQNPAAAQHVASKLIQAANKLEDFPLRYNARHGTLRIMPVSRTPYIIEYEMQDDGVNGTCVVVLGVLDGRRSRVT